MRYSCSEGMIDFARGEIVPFPVLLEELMEFLAEDAQALGCQNELSGLSDILMSGNSAQQQLSVFAEAKTSGADTHQALCHTIDWLIAETVQHCD